MDLGLSSKTMQLHATCITRKFLAQNNIKVLPWPAISFDIYCIDINAIENLTLSQMTNFRLFQTETVCRPQFQI